MWWNSISCFLPIHHEPQVAHAIITRVNREKDIKCQTHAARRISASYFGRSDIRSVVLNGVWGRERRARLYRQWAQSTSRQRLGRYLQDTEYEVRRPIIRWTYNNFVFPCIWYVKFVHMHPINIVPMYVNAHIGVAVRATSALLWHTVELWVGILSLRIAGFTNITGVGLSPKCFGLKIKI